MIAMVELSSKGFWFSMAIAYLMIGYYRHACSCGLVDWHMLIWPYYIFFEEGSFNLH